MRSVAWDDPQAAADTVAVAWEFLRTALKKYANDGPKRGHINSRRMSRFTKKNQEIRVRFEAKLFGNGQA
jgi:hypothetical protein